MARLGRYFVADQPLHVIQRGNDRQPVFFADEDFERFYAWLTDAARTQGCAVHAYVFMTNHVHLLVTPEHARSLPRIMQSVGRRYVGHINAARRRTGTLWGATARRRSTARTICCAACATSSSIRCARAWYRGRRIIAGRATARTSWGRPTRC